MVRYSPIEGLGRAVIDTDHSYNGGLVLSH